MAPKSGRDPTDEHDGNGADQGEDPSQGAEGVSDDEVWNGEEQLHQRAVRGWASK